MKRFHLRHILAVLAALIVIVAFVNLLSGGRSLIVAGVVAAFVVILIVFEVRNYHPKVDRSKGNWHRTNERFVDPITGEHTDVYFNPDSGQRDYRRS